MLGGAPAITRNFGDRSRVLWVTHPIEMKTNLLPIKAFLASLGAIALFPFTAAAAAAVFTVTGIFAVLAADYGRTIEPLRVSAEIVPFGAPGQLAGSQSQAA